MSSQKSAAKSPGVRTKPRSAPVSHPLRFLKSLLTNRFAWTILSIFLELIILIFLYLLLYSNFFPITILAILLSVGITLYIINYYQNLEMRLLWAFIVMSLPIVGSIIFIIFSTSGKNKSLQQKAQRLRNKTSEFYPENTALAELKSTDLSASLQAHYLCEMNHISLSSGNQTTYFPDGQPYFQQLLIDLQSAEKFIFLEYFIIEPGRMWNTILDILTAKVQAGVEVYVMYDDIGSIFTLPSRYYKELNSLGIHCAPANKFNPRLNGFHNNRDHRKIAIIDGKIGYTGGINLADEYINLRRRFGHWKDSGIRLEGPAVTNLLTLFLSSWNLHSKTPLSFDKYITTPIAPNPHEPGYALAFGSGPAPVYEQSVAKGAYLNAINNAKKFLYITSPYLVCDSEILDALALAAEKGVDVRIITPHIPDKKIVYLMTRSNYLPLIKRGVKIYEYQPGFIHAKDLICDDEIAICGTINLDFRSMVYHFECAAWLYQTSCIKSMHADFDQTLTSCHEITPRTAQLKWPLRSIAEILKVFSPLF